MPKHQPTWKGKDVTAFMENISFPIYEEKHHLHENKKWKSGSLLDFHLTKYHRLDLHLGLGSFLGDAKHSHT